MKLPKPFYRLPIRLDVERMRAEVQAFGPDAWAKHPNEIKGNSSVRLISASGGENDDVDGEMLPTAHLQQSPYLRQILASFGVVWSRSRLMRLAPGCGVPQHADINYHWFYRVRLHMPVITRPEVLFRCDGETVHMAAGEVWLFDNWRLHEVENPTPFERIHFVGDTSGSAAFWQFVANADAGKMPNQDVHFDPAKSAAPLTERTLPVIVMPPAELELLARDLSGELEVVAQAANASLRVAQYRQLLDNFCRDWRQLYALHGEQLSGWSELSKLRDSVRSVSMQIGAGLMARTNRIAIHQILEGRILRHVLHLPVDGVGESNRYHRRSDSQGGSASVFDRPVIIVAAPRSGSTLLFETLAASQALCTVGGEAALAIEGQPELRLGAPGIDSNRLVAANLTSSIAARILDDYRKALKDERGAPVDGYSLRRFLEKTPKNALRIPFFNALFPDARFVFLWRDPQENLSSIIAAWRSGNWRTYNGLPGFNGPWSLILPPGWPSMNGRQLEDIAAFQWDTTNRIVLDDLSALTPDRWIALRYADLVKAPGATVSKLCAYLEIAVDESLRERLARPLPYSRYTHTAPNPDKWRDNQAAIERVLPNLTTTWQRLKTLERNI